MRSDTMVVAIDLPSARLEGILGLPGGAQGIVIFAHGSGSSRLSPRNAHVAAALRATGLATLLVDLLTEREAQDRACVFNIQLLAGRLRAAAEWARGERRTANLQIGYFGASTGAAAALVAAADDPRIVAIVSRGGRPDLAGEALGRVEAPTLLIVGGDDHGVIALNESAYRRLRCVKRLEIVPGAGHLFEEPGTLDEVVRLATDWYGRHLGAAGTDDGNVLADRYDAGRRLAGRLMRYADHDPVVLALPRGGVPVGYEVARALAAPLDIVIVRKLGAPGRHELGIGALVDGDEPECVLHDDLIRDLGVSQAYLQREIAAQLAEIHRREERYRGGRPRVPVVGRTAIVVDDGLATGGSMRAALRGVRRARPRRLVLAVPVAPPDTLRALADEVDHVVCLLTPEKFGAVGRFYRDFRQTTDDEVIRLLDAAAIAAGGDGAQVE